MRTKKYIIMKPCPTQSGYPLNRVFHPFSETCDHQPEQKHGLSFQGGHLKKQKESYFKPWCVQFSKTRVFEKSHTPGGVARKIKGLQFSKTILETLFLIDSIPTSFEKKGPQVLIGYARVSTQDQNLDLQREALTKAGCQKVFEDQISGTRADRPGLTKAREMLREGDTLVV